MNAKQLLDHLNMLHEKCILTGGSLEDVDMNVVAAEYDEVNDTTWIELEITFDGQVLT